MSTAASAFMRAVVDAFPVLGSLLEAHLEEQDGELLPHLLMADVGRWVELEVVNSRSFDEVRGLLALLESAFVAGDPEIVEVISASFLEHLPRPTEPGAQIREMVGPQLAARLREIG